MEELNKEGVSPAETAAEPATQTIAAPVAETVAQPVKKGGIGLSITGFIFGIIALLESVSPVLTAYIMGVEIDYLKEAYSGPNTRVIVDTHMLELALKIASIMALIFVLVGFTLATVGLILSIVKTKRVKGIVFAAIGLFASILGFIVIAATGFLF